MDVINRDGGNDGVDDLTTLKAQVKKLQRENAELKRRSVGVVLGEKLEGINIFDSASVERIENDLNASTEENVHSESVADGDECSSNFEDLSFTEIDYINISNDESTIDLLSSGALEQSSLSSGLFNKLLEIERYENSSFQHPSFTLRSVRTVPSLKTTLLTDTDNTEVPFRSPHGLPSVHSTPKILDNHISHQQLSSSSVNTNTFTRPKKSATTLPSTHLHAEILSKMDTSRNLPPPKTAWMEVEEMARQQERDLRESYTQDMMRSAMARKAAGKPSETPTAVSKEIIMVRTASTDSDTIERERSDGGDTYSLGSASPVSISSYGSNLSIEEVTSEQPAKRKASAPSVSFAPKTKLNKPPVCPTSSGLKSSQRMLSKSSPNLQKMGRTNPPARLALPNVTKSSRINTGTITKTRSISHLANGDGNRMQPVSYRDASPDVSTRTYKSKPAANRVPISFREKPLNNAVKPGSAVQSRITSHLTTQQGSKRGVQLQQKYGGSQELLNQHGRSPQQSRGGVVGSRSKSQQPPGKRLGLSVGGRGIPTAGGRGVSKLPAPTGLPRLRTNNNLPPSSPAMYNKPSGDRTVTMQKTRPVSQLVGRNNNNVVDAWSDDMY